jgi:hypothetical protein
MTIDKDKFVSIRSRINILLLCVQRQFLYDQLQFLLLSGMTRAATTIVKQMRMRKLNDSVERLLLKITFAAVKRPTNTRTVVVVATRYIKMIINVINLKLGITNHEVFCQEFSSWWLEGNGVSYFPSCLSRK